MRECDTSIWISSPVCGMLQRFSRSLHPDWNHFSKELYFVYPWSSKMLEIQKLYLNSEKFFSWSYNLWNIPVACRFCEKRNISKWLLSLVHSFFFNNVGLQLHLQKTCLGIKLRETRCRAHRRVSLNYTLRCFPTQSPKILELTNFEHISS